MIRSYGDVDIIDLDMSFYPPEAESASELVKAVDILRQREETLPEANLAVQALLDHEPAAHARQQEFRDHNTRVDAGGTCPADCFPCEYDGLNLTRS